MSQHARIDILSKLKGSDPHLLRMILAGFLITGAAGREPSWRDCRRRPEL